MYFSEREKGKLPQDKLEISRKVWGGFRSLIQARINDGSFGQAFPETCPDSSAVTGTHEEGFVQALLSHVPNLNRRSWYVSDDPRILVGKPPETPDILDVIEFCFAHVARPIFRSYHSFFKHDHLSFDGKAGRADFRRDINTILRRNRLAYTLKKKGRIERLVAPVLHEELASTHYRTGDTELDKMLEKAGKKFVDPDLAVRREGLEALWDAWERLKTLGAGPDKRSQATSLLNDLAGLSSPRFREFLEN